MIAPMQTMFCMTYYCICLINDYISVLVLSRTLLYLHMWCGISVCGTRYISISYNTRHAVLRIDLTHNAHQLTAYTDPTYILLMPRLICCDCIVPLYVAMEMVTLNN